MAELKKSKVPGRVVLMNVRLSYCNVYKPVKQTKDDGTVVDQYSVQILISKKDKDNITKLKNAITEAKEKGKSKLENKNGVIPSNLKICLRDGDTDPTYEGNTSYAGLYFINANNTNKPGLLDANKEVCTDPDLFYSGCYAHVSLNITPFANDKNKGITAYLNNLMFVRDGERLDGRISAEEEFADIPFDDKPL